MTTEKRIAEIRKKLLLGLDKTFEKLIEMKKKKNSVLVISENGKILKITPETAEEKSKNNKSK